MKSFVVTFLVTIGLIYNQGAAQTSIALKYDTLDRLSEISRDATVDTAYSYDATGNRLRKVTRFAPVPATSFSAGQFVGSVEIPSPGAFPARVSVNASKTGKFTALLSIGGKKVRWRGALASSIQGARIWNGTITDQVLGALEIRLEVAPGSNQMTMTLTTASQTTSTQLALAGQGGNQNKEIPAGSYTVLLPANPDFPSASHPQGDGYALLSVSAKGAVKLTGKLGDGTVVTQGAPLTADGRFQVFVPLYKGGGVLTGWIDFVPIDEVSDFNATLQWSKPALSGDPYYSAGFDFEIDLLGSKFRPPLKGERILSLENASENAVLTLGDGNLPESIAKSLTLDANNRVLFSEPGTEAPAFTIATKTGKFTGSFTHPTLGKRAKFSGVVFQKQRLASGFFLGTNQSGHVTLQAKATDAILLPATGIATPGNEQINPPSSGPNYSLSVSASNGTVAKNPNLANYASGTAVQLTATPASGYVFDHWTGDASGTQNPLTVTMTANKSIDAVFSQLPLGSFTISASALPDGGGLISGDGVYASGATVVISATPNQGYSFVNWTENGTEVSTASAYSFSATGNRTLAANFQLDGPIVIQPGPANSKDIWTTSVYSYAPGGSTPGGGSDNEILRVGGWGDVYYSLLEFDLSTAPASATSAVLHLYCQSQSGGGTPMYLDRISEAWDWKTSGTGRDNLRLWWADRPSAEQWIGGELSNPTADQWYTVDITDLYNAWKSGAHQNYGVQLRPKLTSNNNFNTFYSSDYVDDPAKRPKLIVTP